MINDPSNASFKILANTFACREFVFNFEGDRYLRHQAYSGVNDLKNEVKRMKPYKIDIGAVYNIS